MSVFFTLFKKEVREQWRTYRLLIVAAVLMVFGLSSPLLARYMPELLKAVPDVPPEIANAIPTATIADAFGQYVKNLTQFGVILALLVPMGAVAQEKERGTAAMLLSKPVSRGTFVLAKFAALVVTFLTGLALAAVGGYYYTGILFEWPDVGSFTALNGLMLVYLLVFVGLTVFASSLGRSQLASGGIAFGLMMLLALSGAIPQVSKYLPGSVVAWGGRLVMGGGGSPAWSALWASLGLIAAALAGAWLVLRRQEI